MLDIIEDDKIKNDLKNIFKNIDRIILDLKGQLNIKDFIKDLKKRYDLSPLDENYIRLIYGMIFLSHSS